MTFIRDTSCCIRRSDSPFPISLVLVPEDYQYQPHMCRWTAYLIQPAANIDELSVNWPGQGELAIKDYIDTQCCTKGNPEKICADNIYVNEEK